LFQSRGFDWKFALVAARYPADETVTGSTHAQRGRRLAGVAV
jgi:hypothetical protein